MAPFRVGVMVENVQLSDVACVEIIGNLSKAYMALTADLGYQEFLPLALDLDVLYISSTLEPAFMTPSVKILPTVTYDDCPRDLDILLIGGPPPSHRPDAAGRFMAEAAKRTKVILTTCVGSMWLASAGVLDGKKATTNRECLGMASMMHPGVEWLDQRWVVDGAIWTSGGAGAGAGYDMVATYALQAFDSGSSRPWAWLCWILTRLREGNSTNDAIEGSSEE